MVRAGTGEFIAQMYVFAERLRAEYDQAAHEAGLTAQQAVILTLLSEPLSMRALAERRHCDASNITGIVDRLEAKGLVERAPDAADRRVRLVRPTPAGRRSAGSFRTALERISSLSGCGTEQRRRLLNALPEPGENQEELP